MSALELRGVSKFFGDVLEGTVALRDVTLAVPERSIVGLIGRNGSGKTTLLRHVTGLVLPNTGECITLGQPAARLGHAEFSRLGVVDQDAALIEWMRVDQLLRYVSTFYATWDATLERDLVRVLELRPQAVVGTLSPGTAQRLSLVLALCHRPELLLLDEPLSDLDPEARERVLALLLDRFTSDGCTIVISSHMLRDIESVVNRIVCLDRGQVVVDDELDALHERYAEWIVTSSEGRLPRSFGEPYVISTQGDAQRARLVVRDGTPHIGAFEAKYGAGVERRALNLERIFPLLTAASVDSAMGAATSDRHIGASR